MLRKFDPQKLLKTVIEHKIFCSKKRALSFVFLLAFVLNISIFSYAVVNISQSQSPNIKVQKDSGHINPNSVVFPVTESTKPEKRNHAPEPGTLMLFGSSGALSAIVQFARRRYRDAKRIFDICLSAVGIIISLPILLIAMALIKLTSKGPIFYTQKRVGENGKIFEIIKLRTMFVDAEKNCGAIWAKENDPRITAVGRILRKTHIDEIPQLVNVLRGQMSVIGPRPERPEFVEDLSKKVDGYSKRLSVKPGITGLAQVWHKYDETIEDVKKKIKYDILYIKHMCWWVDFRILFRTCFVVLTGKGAR